MITEELYFKGKVKKMNARNIMTGVGIGMAVGGASAYIKGAMAGTKMRKNAKKRMNKAMKSMEGIIGDVKYMFK